MGADLALPTADATAVTKTPAAKPAPKKKGAKPTETEVVKQLKAAIVAARKRRDLYLPTWQDNVARRVNQPLVQDQMGDQVVVSTDWSRTKNKQAQLFFQCPTIRLTARQPNRAQQAAVFAAAINFELERIHAYAAIDECMADAINGAGLAAAIVGYTGTFETVDLPASAPPPPMPGMPGPPPAGAVPAAPALPGMPPVAPPPPQMVPVERAVYECYYLDRISPSQFLWPAEFKGSDWTKAPWLGCEGYLPLAEAKRRKRSDGETPWVPDSFEGISLTCESLADDVNLIGAQSLEAGQYVKFVQLFYYANRFDKEELHPEAIRRLVLVEGLEEEDGPVIDEPFQWQKYVKPVTTLGPNGKPHTVPGHYVGMTTLPIKVLTLTTVSDLAIPPSDTEIGKAQVDELNAHRSMMVRERKSSLPLRGYDVNLIDPEVADLLRTGKQQDMIPVNGPGERAIFEIARANYPRVNIEGMNVITRDLDESWSMSASQQGTNASSETTAAEVKSTDSWASVRLEYERARTLRFALSLAEGLGQLMQLFADSAQYVEVIGPDGAAALEQWDKTTIAGEYLFKAQPDSAVKVDVNAKRAEFLNFYKLVRRDPLVNAQALLLMGCELYGLDPSKFLKPEQPPPKKEPALRFTYKGEDMLNPISLAVLQTQGVQITAQQIAAARQLIQGANILVPPPTGGEPPTGGAAPAAAVAPHPGAVEQVDPIGQRYGGSGGPSESE